MASQLMEPSTGCGSDSDSTLSTSTAVVVVVVGAVVVGATVVLVVVVGIVVVVVLGGLSISNVLVVETRVVDPHVDRMVIRTKATDITALILTMVPIVTQMQPKLQPRLNSG